MRRRRKEPMYGANPANTAAICGMDAKRLNLQLHSYNFTILVVLTIFDVPSHGSCHQACAANLGVNHFTKPQNNSGGLVSCSFQQTDRYDDNRHFAVGVPTAVTELSVAASTPVPIAVSGAREMLKLWDFILIRADGSSVSLHPTTRAQQFRVNIWS